MFPSIQILQINLNLQKKTEFEELVRSKRSGIFMLQRINRKLWYKQTSWKSKLFYQIYHLFSLKYYKQIYDDTKHPICQQKKYKIRIFSI